MRAWASVILAVKHGSRRHTTGFSENVVVTETSYLLEVLSLDAIERGILKTSSNKNTRVNFSGEKKLSEAFQSIFLLRIR